jgi:hypothetical protein
VSNMRTIWFMWKTGEERTYAMTTQPPSAWAEIQRNAGFFLVSINVELPDPSVSSEVKVTYSKEVGQEGKVPNSGFLEFKVEDTAIGMEELAKRFPRTVVEVGETKEGLVALCGGFALYKRGAILKTGSSSGVFVARVLVDPSSIHLSASEDDLQSIDSISRLACWWHAHFPISCLE